MRIVVAPDSFKESLSAAAVCAAVAAGVRRARRDAAVVSVPLSDGGEGLVAVLLADGAGAIATAATEDPLGRPRRAPLALLDGGRTIALEVAHAVGLALLAPGERDPLRASSHGVGLLLRAALARRPDTILVGLGGSATVDGGGGMAQALGAGLFDATGRRLPAAPAERFAGRHLTDVARVAPDTCRRACDGVRIEALADVTTPLLDDGRRLGAARLYGPQKGATPDDVARLALGLERLAAALARAGHDVGALPGGGAAGGLGAALHAFCGAAVVSGFERVAARVGLAAAIAGADLVVTGEGRLDRQTAEGKVVAGVARTAAAAGVPAVAIVGDVERDEGEDATTATHRAARTLGLAAVRTLVSRAGSVAAAQRDAAAHVAAVAADLLDDVPDDRS